MQAIGWRKQIVIGALVVPILLLVAFFLWPREPPDPSGAWMQRAGVSPRYLDAGGVRIRYVRRGSGTPVVLVHGFASSIYTWSGVLPVLAQRHDVIAIDLPGFGGSDIPTHLGGEARAELLSRVMDGLGVQRASFAGNSLGGALSAVTAARHPERVERLVLLDAAGYNMAAADRPLMLRVLAAVPSAVVEAFPPRPLMRLGLKQVFFDDSLVTDEKVEEYLAPMARKGARAAARAMLTGGETFGLPGVLRQVRAPTLVIWGAGDTWIPPRDADRFLRDIPGARKVILERCGHVPQEEKPAEVAALIGGFLQ